MHACVCVVCIYMEPSIGLIYCYLSHVTKFIFVEKKNWAGCDQPANLICSSEQVTSVCYIAYYFVQSYQSWRCEMSLYTTEYTMTLGMRSTDKHGDDIICEAVLYQLQTWFNISCTLLSYFLCVLIFPPLFFYCLAAYWCYVTNWRVYLSTHAGYHGIITVVILL